MQVDRDQILNLIYNSIDALNEQFARNNWLEKSPQTLLSGTGGALDSLGFVNLVANIEEKVEGEFGIGLSLTDTAVVASGEDPFHSIGSLADHLSLLLEEKQRNNR